MSKTIKGVDVKRPAFWSIGIMFPNGKKIVKPRCTLNNLFETYFINLEKYLNTDITPEELLNKYKEKFKSSDIKIAIRYTDSWGHKWGGKIAWPKEEKFINYLNSKLNERIC